MYVFFWQRAMCPHRGPEAWLSLPPAHWSHGPCPPPFFTLLPLPCCAAWEPCRRRQGSQAAQQGRGRRVKKGGGQGPWDQCAGGNDNQASGPRWGHIALCQKNTYISPSLKGPLLGQQFKSSSKAIITRNSGRRFKKQTLRFTAPQIYCCFRTSVPFLQSFFLFIISHSVYLIYCQSSLCFISSLCRVQPTNRP